jgi:hypothetical protein
MARSPLAMPVDSVCIFMHDARVFMQTASEIRAAWQLKFINP